MSDSLCHSSQIQGRGDENWERNKKEQFLRNSIEQVLDPQGRPVSSVQPRSTKQWISAGCFPLSFSFSLPKHSLLRRNQKIHGIREIGAEGARENRPQAQLRGLWSLTSRQSLRLCIWGRGYCYCSWSLSTRNQFLRHFSVSNFSPQIEILTWFILWKMQELDYRKLKN